MDEFKTHPNALKALNELLSQKTNKTARSAEEELFDFKIDSTGIVSIEKDNYNSFTFSIYRDKDNGLEENLFLHLEPDGSYSSYIIQYNLSQSDKDGFRKGVPIPDLKDKTKIIPVAEAARGLGCVPQYKVNCVYLVITTTYTVPLDEGDLTGNFGWQTVSVNSYELVGCTYTYLGCHDYDGGGGGSGSGPGGLGGGGLFGGNNPPTNPESNTPIIGLIIRDPNIKKLKDITNDPSKPYKEKVDILRGSLNDDTENGFEFSTDDQGNLLPAVQGIRTPTGVIFPIPTKNSLVRMHDHHVGLEPVFSAQDVSGMANFFVIKNDYEADDDEEIVSLLIVPGGAYALTVDDPDLAWNFNRQFTKGNNVENEQAIEIYIANYRAEVSLAAQRKCGNCPQAELDQYLADNFISWFNDKDTGLGLYKGVETTLGNYTWIKLN